MHVACTMSKQFKGWNAIVASACQFTYKTTLAMDSHARSIDLLAEGLPEAAAGLTAGSAAAVAAQVTFASGAAEAAGAAAAFAFVFALAFATASAAAASSSAATMASAVSIAFVSASSTLLHLALSMTAPLPVQLPAISVQLWFHPLQLLWRLTLQSQKYLQN